MSSLIKFIIGLCVGAFNAGQDHAGRLTGLIAAAVVLNSFQATDSYPN